MNEPPMGLAFLMLTIVLSMGLLVGLLIFIIAMKRKEVRNFLHGIWSDIRRIIPGLYLMATSMIILAAGFILFVPVTTFADDQLKAWQPSTGIMHSLTDWYSWHLLGLIPLAFLIWIIAGSIWFMWKGVKTMRGDYASNHQ